MYLKKLQLNNYRNYESVQQNFLPQINIFIGLNAQGKTNLLEAIYYLSTGKSYRPVRDFQLIKWQNDFFSLYGEVENKVGITNIEIKFKHLQPPSKEIKINGLKIEKYADLWGCLTTVLFAPEDLDFIKGSPSERRKLLDHDISQVSPSYYIMLQKHQRLLHQRNHLLKRTENRKKIENELEVWDQQYLQVSAEIILKRLEVLEKIIPLTRLMHRRLTNGQENLEIKYLLNRKSELKKNSPLTEILQQERDIYRQEEIYRGMTLWGPHRDDLAVTLNGHDLKSFGSQGQHRTAVLAIKLAELEFIKAETGEYPVLLLDDVLSELDIKRREHLLKTVQEKAIQCFITTTEDLKELFCMEATKNFVINQGKLEEKKGGN